MKNLTATQLPRRAVLIAGASAALASPWLQAQTSPQATPALASGKVVKLIVGFPAGQATDIVARLLAERMRAVTGDNYVVENRPGTGGSLALGVLAKAPADGSVMMLAHMSAVATNPHIYQSVPYDSAKDFEPVGLVGDLPFVLVVNSDLPVKNLSELIAYARANPDKLTNASSGNGTVSHLAMEEIKRKAGLKITHIPYKGSVAGLTDVVSGNVSMALETASAVRPHIESGRLRALAVGSTKRLGGVLANVPTLAESNIAGLGNFNAVTWLMLLYPAGTPKATGRATFNALKSVMSLPETEQKLTATGLQTRTSNSPEEANAYLKSELANWGDVVKRSGIPKE
jgi:tripartite-type tricarboxylate transporter receptor subunit TctC